VARNGDFQFRKNEGVMMNTKTTKTSAAHGDGKVGESDAMKVNNQSVSIEAVGHSLKQGIVHSLAGLNTIETDIVSLVRKTVSDTLRTGGTATGELINVVHHIVMGAIGAAEQVGNGLSMSIKSVAKGVVMGVNDVGGDVVAASAETVRSVIKHGANIGSDIGVIAKHAVNGVIEATVETGGNATQAGKNAIEGAIEEAGKISDLAVKTVKEVLSGVVGGLSDTLGVHTDTTIHPSRTVKKPHAGSGRVSH
jgi:hypothetical protein